MESLLRWGIENSSTNGQSQPLQPRTDLDTSIIDHILGKSDSVLMQEALAVAIDGDRSEDERVSALDDLEMVSLVPYIYMQKAVIHRVHTADREYRQCE
jgi:hsp70-interacting protein